MTAAVELIGVEKYFASRDSRICALDGINLSVARGGFITVLGPSGCGKSTLLSLVAGLDEPTSGEIRIDGAILRGPNTSAGVVFQRDLLLDWRTAIQNVLLQFEMRGLSSAPHREEAQRLLDQVGIGTFAQSFPNQLSGGMRQRVAICRALIHRPSLLLMDEPFGALDAITREKMILDLSHLTGMGDKTVVFVTHSIEEAVFLGDRVIVMSARPGRIVADIAVDVPRPRAVWPRGLSPFDPYIAQAREALEQAGAYAAIAS